MKNNLDHFAAVRVGNKCMLAAMCMLMRAIGACFFAAKIVALAWAIVFMAWFLRLKGKL